MKANVKVLLSLLVSLFLSGSVVSGQTLFRTIASGSWHSLGTWEMSTNSGSSWIPATMIPNLSTHSATIRSPHLITTNDGSSSAAITINVGGTLDVGNSPTYDFITYGTVTNNGTISGTGGSNFHFSGLSLVNTGSITTTDIFFDTTTSISGAGSYSGATITFQSSSVITLSSNVTFSPTSSMSVNGTLNPNSFIMSYTGPGNFTLLSGATVINSGSVRMQGNFSAFLNFGSFFNAPLTIISGTVTTTDGRIFGPLTVDPGATLSAGNSPTYDFITYGTVTNNGTISGTGGSNFHFSGLSLVNTGSITTTDIFFDTTTSISGAGSYSGATITFQSTSVITLSSNVTFSPTSSMSVNGTFNPNSFIMTYTGPGNFSLGSGATVVNSGSVRMQGIFSAFLNYGSFFNAPLTIVSGTVTTTDGRIFGPLTVDPGATLSAGNSTTYEFFSYGTITNSGTIAGTSGSNFYFNGSSLINNGSITTSDILFDSATSISGTGTFTGTTITMQAPSDITLSSNVTFSPTSSMSVNGTLNPNSFIMTYTGPGNFGLGSGATVVNSGSVRMQGIFSAFLNYGSFFNAPLTILSGTVTTTDGRIFGSLTVDPGATLDVGNSATFDFFSHGTVTNNGTITGAAGANFTLDSTGSITNNNLINVSDLVFASGVTTLNGAGTITSNIYANAGSNTTVTGNHQLNNLTINSGAIFSIANVSVKFTDSNPIIQNGTFNTTNSSIEYNGTAFQTVSTANIVYHKLKINNSSSTGLAGNVTVNDTLSVILGDLDLSGRILTLAPTGYLTETAGNTITGATGYITTTRNVGTPASLNVGGLGAILTATTNLGSTEIRRGHGVQTGGSIKRYFDITPTNNVGLSATLKFKYDDSELNLRPEPILRLIKSTNGGTSFSPAGGSINTALNEITLSGITSFSRWSADSTGAAIIVGIAIEGFYNASTNRQNMVDTVRVYFRNTTSPYALVDSAKSLLDSVTMRLAIGTTTLPGGTYYLQLIHRNALETWSASGQTYTPGSTMVYDFTTAANKAFGDNMKQVDASPLRFAIYSGDPNQDGAVDLSDIVAVFNDANNFISGYVVTDINGDDFVDLTDLTITFNNSNAFVSVIRP